VDNSYGESTRGKNYIFLEPCVENCRNVAAEDVPIYVRAEFEIISQRNNVNYTTGFGRFVPEVHKFLVARLTEFATVTPHICGPSVWNLLAVTVLASTILELNLDFWKICAPLVFLTHAGHSVIGLSLLKPKTYFMYQQV
jgi:hypothetical protein